MPQVKYWKAINRAMDDSLAEDARVCVFGEDVGAPGGAFGATAGLQDRYGSSRIRDTPISEAAIVGTAVGAAMVGMRPVVEVMFMDFMTLAMDQLVNQAAKVSFMSGGSFHVPLVVRTLVGAGRGTGPQHSQSFEGWLANVPGLKVVWPSTPTDAYGLLRSAIEDDDPVVVMESLRLWSLREDWDGAPSPVPLGKAVVRRVGTDATVVAWGSAVHRALAAAELCSQSGLEAEVIDLRSITPLDTDIVLSSLEKTGRMLVVEDGPGRVGVGALVVALASDAGFSYLKAPAAIVSSPFAPAPFAPPLEEAFFPSPSRIGEAIGKLVAVP